MSTSVGAIDLGLSINKSYFGRELNGLGNYATGQVKSAFAGVGKVLGLVIATGTIIKFTKECVDLGSDLAEVQNVVDVTFGSMSSDIDSFAKTAITQFGLSETSAKEYSSTMGAMLKSMGFTTKSALEMSKSITGLSADMASFYNLDNQTAFEKIRSGISGETEPLKQLGINMSVANLEAYALSNGITTAYNSMTQQQQALLRYNYLMSVTADAQGDFARTSSGWANQTRILSENFNALKAELGQAFIAVATPVLSMMNSIITKLQQAASAFRSFIDAITGNDSTDTSSIANDMSAVATAASTADDAVAGIGASAEKAKKALMGFDEINILSLDDSTDTTLADTATATPSTGGNADAVAKSMTDAESKITSLIDKANKKFNEQAKLFKQGFEIGIGDGYKDKLNDIQQSVFGIKKSIADIFIDTSVQSAFDSFSKTATIALGQIVGAGASIGTTVSQNFVGGFDKYLSQNKGFISERIVSTIQSAEEIASQTGNFSTAFADVFDVFGEDTAQQITANIIGIFSNAFLGALDLGMQFGADLYTSITQPFIDNKDAIKTAIENTLKPIETITVTLKKSVDDTFTAAQQTYDEHISPMFDNFTEGTSKMSSSILKWYNDDMSPVISDLADDWSTMYSESVQPNIDKSIEIVGKFGQAVGLFWNNVAAPFVDWFITTFGPKIADNTQQAGDSVIEFATKANNNLGKVLDVFNDIMDAIILLLDSFGDFKDNWATGMDEIISGLKGDKIKNVLNQLSTDVKNISKGMVNALIDDINWFINKTNEKLKFKLPDVLGGGEFNGLNIPTIPKLAQGGIIQQPTLAMVGESGIEAVMPLENNTGWIDELASKIAMIILAQGNTGSATNTDNTPIEIIIEIGGVRFGKVVLDSLNELKKQNGRLKFEF